MKKNVIVFALALMPVLSSCAYVTAKPVTSGSTASGIPFYGVRNYVVVRGNEVVSIAMPDCSQKYVLQIGTFLAKNHTIIKFSNGVITELDTDQDSTAAIVPLFDFAKSVVNPANPSGSAMSEESAGTDGSNFGLFVADCADGNLKLTPAISSGQMMTLILPDRTDAPKKPDPAPRSSAGAGADDTGDPVPKH